MWLWESTKPGIRVLPARSTRWVPRPCQRMTSPSSPTARISPSRTASARAVGAPGTIVRIDPLWKIRSAASPAGRSVAPGEGSGPASVGWGPSVGGRSPTPPTGELQASMAIARARRLSRIALISFSASFNYRRSGKGRILPRAPDRRTGLSLLRISYPSLTMLIHKLPIKESEG